MEIEVWKELTDLEELYLDNAEFVSESNSLHVTEIRRKLGDLTFRSIYLIETGELISHEKLVEIVDLDKISNMKKGSDELVG